MREKMDVHETGTAPPDLAYRQRHAALRTAAVSFIFADALPQTLRFQLSDGIRRAYRVKVTKCTLNIGHILQIGVCVFVMY